MSHLKRIQNEIPDILEKYNNINVFYSKHYTKIIIRNNIIFILEPNYPFNPPQIIINNVPYIHFLKAPSPRINNLFQYFSISCPCCNTITCMHNWSPSTRITTIMEEINKTNQLKTKIKYKMAVDDICTQKNIDTNSIGRYILQFLYK